MARYFGGVEGGGTNTVVVIVNEAGKIVGEARGGGSNGYVRGVAAARRRSGAASARARGPRPASHRLPARAPARPRARAPRSSLACPPRRTC